jgi:uncharacterized protein (DUF952 family)
MLLKLVSFIGIMFMAVGCTVKVEDQQTFYKILTIQQWQEFQNKKTFYGSEMDVKDGFIHLSFKNQIDGIREKFFKNKKELVLVSLYGSTLNNEYLKIEANKPGGNQYPHYYSTLKLEMVIDVKVTS